MFAILFFCPKCATDQLIVLSFAVGRLLRQVARGRRARISLSLDAMTRQGCMAMLLLGAASHLQLHNRACRCRLDIHCSGRCDHCRRFCTYVGWLALVNLCQVDELVLPFGS